MPEKKRAELPKIKVILEWRQVIRNNKIQNMYMFCGYRLVYIVINTVMLVYLVRSFWVFVLPFSCFKLSAHRLHVCNYLVIFIFSIHRIIFSKKSPISRPLHYNYSVLYVDSRPFHPWNPINCRLVDYGFELLRASSKLSFELGYWTPFVVVFIKPGSIDREIFR